MVKDIFIDNVIISRHFTNPPTPRYKELIDWLQKYNKSKPQNNAYLVVSEKLLGEYTRTCSNSKSDWNIHTIISLLSKQGRLKKIKNDEIKKFKSKYYKKHVANNLRSTGNDKNYHIPTVMLSKRKYALTADNNFCYDINNFPRCKALAACAPNRIPYKK